jgi:hypothetical protein
MIMGRRRRGVLVALAVLSTLGAARPARAAGDDAPVDSAASHFHHGVALYKDADYAGALVEFRRAQALSPNYRVLYNIGQSLYQLQRYAEAFTAFEEYLAEGAAQVAPARRAAVETDLRALRARTGSVEVAVNVDGAEVRIDDQAVGTSPLAAPVLVSVGHRKVTVAPPDRVPMEKFIDVAVGDHAKTSFDFSAPSTAASAPTQGATPPGAREAGSLSPTPAPGAEPPRQGSLAWIPWAVTGVLAAGTAVTGALTLTAKGALSSDLATFPGDSNAISQDRSRAKGYSAASDVLLAASAVSFGVALYVTLRSHPSPPGDLGADVKLRLGLDGVRLHVVF